ncbi:MAG: carboxypeptidase-like regulatory domain-containing protein, partial [Vicinamibacterales bacterium]
MRTTLIHRIELVLVLFVAAGMAVAAQAGRQGGAANAGINAVAIDPDDIGGVVTGASGPEAGVWVIAETTDLPTKFRKIVVTDDQGRYVLPDLPNANYSVWVRGYGLVDSAPVMSRRGQRLALRAVGASTPVAAAHYFPGNYWLSLMNIPKADEFPMRVPRVTAPINAPEPAAQERVLANQAEWVFTLKRGCEACHQLGPKATREIPKSLGTFDSTAAAWERLVRSGQVGSG